MSERTCVAIRHVAFEGLDEFEPWLIGHAAELAGANIDVAVPRLDADRREIDLISLPEDRREDRDARAEALQAGLDAWFVHYNTERPRLGYRTQGR